MPDVDLDFDYHRIDEVIQYTKDKYGEDNVSKIGTFGTLGAKTVVKDVARVLKYDYDTINSLTTKVNDIDIKIDQMLEKYPAFQELADSDEDFARIIEISKRLEGLQRHTSKHAAGIVISPFPLTDLIPLSNKDGDAVSQFSMGILEELGFVKMDYLRLRTLSIIKGTIDLIKEREGIEIDIDRIDYEDDKVFEKFRNGETIGIFQFESQGMSNLLKRQQPTKLDDLSAVNSLYRPGPLDCIDNDPDSPNYGKKMVDIYIERANGTQETSFDHPLLEPVLKKTFGVFVFQEELMQGAVALAGYTLSEADGLRKVVGKKKLDKIPQQKKKFITGCLELEGFVKNCGDKEPVHLAERIWNQIETFGRYGFNASHSLAYTVLAYQSMWLKTYYPTYFMASVLTSMIGEKVQDVIPYLNECRRLGIKLLPPDINTSSNDYAVSEDKTGIHFSLVGIKGVGEKAVADIMSARERHKFASLVDFLLFTGKPVNKTVVLSLAKCGAFDSFGHNRMTSIETMKELLEIKSNVKKKITANKKRKNPEPDIAKFYDPLYNYEVATREEMSIKEICAMERELTGFYMTHHPLEEIIGYLQEKTTHPSNIINDGESFYNEDIDDYETIRLPEGQTVLTGGVIMSVKETTIKNGRNKGKLMAHVFIEDAFQGEVKCTVFNREYEKCKSIIRAGNVVFIKGSVNYFNDSASINVSKIVEINMNKINEEQYELKRRELMNAEREIRHLEKSIMLIVDADLINHVCEQITELYDRRDVVKEEIGKLEESVL